MAERTVPKIFVNVYMAICYGYRPSLRFRDLIGRLATLIARRGERVEGPRRLSRLPAFVGKMQAGLFHPDRTVVVSGTYPRSVRERPTTTATWRDATPAPFRRAESLDRDERRTVGLESEELQPDRVSDVCRMEEEVIRGTNVGGCSAREV